MENDWILDLVFLLSRFVSFWVALVPRQQRVGPRESDSSFFGRPGPLLTGRPMKNTHQYRILSLPSAPYASKSETDWKQLRANHQSNSDSRMPAARLRDNFNFQKIENEIQNFNCVLLINLLIFNLI